MQPLAVPSPHEKYRGQKNNKVMTEYKNWTHDSHYDDIDWWREQD